MANVWVLLANGFVDLANPNQSIQWVVDSIVVRRKAVARKPCKRSCLVNLGLITFSYIVYHIHASLII